MELLSARPKALLAAVALVAALAGAAGAGAGATQAFSDVGATHPFRAEIEQFADAGISSGYPDGTFRPGTPVSRQAMAAFLTRGLPSVMVAWDDALGPFGAPDGLRPLVARSATLPWGEGATQHVIVRGTVDWKVDRTLAQACSTQANGSCGFQLSIRSGGEVRATSNTRITGDWDGGTAVVEAVFAVPDGGDFAPALYFQASGDVLDDSVLVHQAQLTTETVPFVLPDGLPL